ncbi:unnamed protein product [Heligmosomoides polygyrus]|uniref:Uncharacterized protein n=1 Tax=Heligmosomoides polygyrus TaxID=6339 RepID=A0A183GGV6_HELPZ|nr:unnamed protein product [Heligmosomoides polygyrus]
MRNEDVRAVMKSAPIQLMMREQRLRCYGHVFRRLKDHPISFLELRWKTEETVHSRLANLAAITYDLNPCVLTAAVHCVAISLTQCDRRRRGAPEVLWGCPRERAAGVIDCKNADCVVAKHPW